MIVTCKLCANALVSWTVSFLNIIFSAVKRRQVWTVIFNNVVSRFKLLQSLEKRIFNRRNIPKYENERVDHVSRLTRGTRRPRTRTKQVRELERMYTHDSAAIVKRPRHSFVCTCAP